MIWEEKYSSPRQSFVGAELGSLDIMTQVREAFPRDRMSMYSSPTSTLKASPLLLAPGILVDTNVIDAVQLTLPTPGKSRRMDSGSRAKLHPDRLQRL